MIAHIHFIHSSRSLYMVWLMLGVVSFLRTIQENKYGMFRVVQWRDRNKVVVSEMTYTVSSGTLNSTIPYHTETHIGVLSENPLLGLCCARIKGTREKMKMKKHAMILIHPSPPPPNPSRQQPYFACRVRRLR